MTYKARPVFARPIEINSTNRHLDVRNISGTATSVTLDTGVYACIHSFAYDFCTQLVSTTFIDTMTATFSGSNFATTFTGDVYYRLEWSDTPLADIFGFNSATSTASQVGSDWVLTSSYRPNSVWLPTYIQADQDCWVCDSAGQFSGGQTLAGNLAGVTTGPVLYYRKFKFVHESAVNVIRSVATSTYWQTRCLEQFMYDARLATPVEVTGVSVKGFYVFPDLNNALATISSAMGDGGVAWDIGGSANTYVFCHPSPEGFKLDGAAMPQGRDRYHCSFSVHTATAPTWGGVIP
jgi:hypothetical protein